MQDYTESQKMFSDRFYEIIAKYQLEIPEIVFDYFAQLSKEDLQKIEEEIISYDSIKSIAKLRITAEISKFKTEAQAWKESREAPETSIESHTVVFEEQQDYEDVSVEDEHNNELVKVISHLNPRYHNNDLFIANVELNHICDDMPSMEYPIFALKAGNDEEITFEINGVKTTVSSLRRYGRATIFDKDVWIYCISKLMQAKFKGQEIKNTIEFTIHDFLMATNRKKIGGSQYKMFVDSLKRLRGTTITTEIPAAGNQEDIKIFGLLEGADLIKDKNGRIHKVVVELPYWLYRSVLSNDVLKISNDYFLLRKPIDRRIYEIVSKHMGRKNTWSIGLKKLHQKTGASMNSKEFRRNIQSLIETNELPDFEISYERLAGENKEGIVTFTRRTEINEQLLEEKKKNAEACKKRQSKNNCSSKLSFRRRRTTFTI